jgi:hypothetical protein
MVVRPVSRATGGGPNAATDLGCACANAGLGLGAFDNLDRHINASLADANLVA